MRSWIPPKTRVLKILMTRLIPKVFPRSNLRRLDHPNLLGSSGLHQLDFHFLGELLQPTYNMGVKRQLQT